jgi:excisionase family DNA binding protein
MSESQPLFMRLPAVAAEHLEQMAREGSASKREVVTRLILGDDLAVGRAAFHPVEELAVLTSSQAAELLQIDEALLLDLAEAGQVPARRLGEHWRFSRAAILEWLGGREGSQSDSDSS